jgi:hypothetical protein
MKYRIKNSVVALTKDPITVLYVGESPSEIYIFRVVDNAVFFRDEYWELPNKS